MTQASVSRPSILNVHTPTSSFAIIHSLNQESLTLLFDKLSKKAHADYRGQRVGPGWLKYEYGDTIWDLDDDSDYAIFSWRQQSYQVGSPESDTDDMTAVPAIAIGEPGPSKLPASSAAVAAGPTPTLHLHNPAQPLPVPPAYRNPSYYIFRPTPIPKVSPPSSAGRSSRRSSRKKDREDEANDGVPKLMKQFEKFHNENGVRTVMGSIGPVKNVRMLLKVGYRHVYISRKFAQKHGFVPRDATPGNYGYGGLVNIGTWPITLVTSSSSSRGGTSNPSQDRGNDSDTGFGEGESLLRPPAKAGAIGLGLGHDYSRGRKVASLGYRSTCDPAPSTIVLSSSRSSTVDTSALNSGTNGTNDKGSYYPHSMQQRDQQQRTEVGAKPTVTHIQVYLCEEPHFDVVLGRSFFDKRQIKTSPIDPTDVVCLDTGEKIECEVVVLRDGKGDIVTVT